MKKHIPLFAFFWLLTIAFYGITYRAGFVTDFMGWMNQFDNYSFKTVITGEKYTIRSFYHFTHIIMYGLTAAFRMSPWVWFGVFSALFALNATLIFSFFKKIFDALALKNAAGVAMMGVLAFFLSPYQAEVMVWRASFHYLTAFSILLIFIHLTLKFIEKPASKYVVIALILYACSIFSLEYFLFTPFVAGIVLLFWALNFPNSFNIKKTVFSFVGIPLSMVGIYFLFFRFVNGKWVAHYGIDSDKNLFSMASFARYGKYVTKHLTFARHLEHKTKDAFFAFFDTPSVSAAILVGIFAFSILGLVFYKKLTARGRLIHLNFALFSVLLVPVLSFFFSWTLLSENDRYGYIPSAFLMMGAFLVLSRLPKGVFYAVSIAYLLFSSYLLIKTNRIWWKSEKVIDNCLATFRWWDADEVFVLSAPDNYRGIPMFRSDWVSSTLAEGIESRHQRKLKPRIYDVMQYNMTTPSDGVNVVVESDSVLVVTLNQWGNWWFKKGIGATSFETPDFSVKNDFNGCGRCFKFILKNRKPNRAYIFQVGNEWREVDWTKIGVEQR